MLAEVQALYREYLFLEVVWIEQLANALDRNYSSPCWHIQPE